MTRGARIRVARPADAEAIAAVQVRGWQAAHRDDLPAGFLAGLSVEQRATGWRDALAGAGAGAAHRTLVARLGGSVVGFAHAGPSAEDPGRAQLHALYVDPPAWDQGVGRALADAALAALADQGFREADLWVVEGNQRARRFYRAAGWVPDGAARTETYGGARVRLLRYRRRLRRAAPATPGPDSEKGQALGGVNQPPRAAGARSSSTEWSERSERMRSERSN